MNFFPAFQQVLASVLVYPWVSWFWHTANPSTSIQNWMIIAGLQIINIPVYRILIHTFFEDMKDFAGLTVQTLLWLLLYPFHYFSQDDDSDENSDILKLLVFWVLLVGLTAIEYKLVVNYIIFLF